jgi:DNA-binding NarL/FixJ family response regulator
MGNKTVVGGKIKLTKKYELLIAETDINYVQMLANGFTRNEISEQCGLSKRTIELRFQILYGIFQAKTAAHLVAIFYRDNLID